jgi:hypothetical protein
MRWCYATIYLIMIFGGWYEIPLTDRSTHTASSNEYTLLTSSHYHKKQPSYHIISIQKSFKFFLNKNKRIRIVSLAAIQQVESMNQKEEGKSRM